MHNIVNNYLSIKNELKLKYLSNKNINIVAVSKTFSMDQIKPLLDYGHNHFGENKVQEAIEKWKDIRQSNSNLKLHLIGKLQTNKVKFVIPLFDYIHSLDNIRLAKKISSEQIKFNKRLKIFIQVNIGDEIQKNGIPISELSQFYKICVNDLNLDIVGLMCIPPNVKNTDTYFSKLQQLNKTLGLDELSMGMSSDYLKAIDYGSTYVRIGSSIFGSRL